MGNPTVVYRQDKDGNVHIGNARGRIAVWLDETEANDMAFQYGINDIFYNELMKAIEVAYPKGE